MNVISQGTGEILVLVLVEMLALPMASLTRSCSRAVSAQSQPLPGQLAARSNEGN